MLLGLLHACHSDGSDDSGVVDTSEGLPADTAGDTDTDTTIDDTAVAHDPWEPVIPACDLVAPLPVTPDVIPSFYDLYGPDLILLVSLRVHVDNLTEHFGCPTRTEDVEAGTVTYDGSCANDEHAYEGRWAVDGPELAYALERDLALDIDTYADWIDGTWYARSTEYAVGEDDWIVEEMYVDALPDVGLVGDYCVTRDTVAVPACAREPFGGWVLQASSTVIVTFDPYEACDGCANVDGRRRGRGPGVWERLRRHLGRLVRRDLTAPRLEGSGDLASLAEELALEGATEREGCHRCEVERAAAQRPRRLVHRAEPHRGREGAEATVEGGGGHAGVGAGAGGEEQDQPAHQGAWPGAPTLLASACSTAARTVSRAVSLTWSRSLQ